MTNLQFYSMNLLSINILDEMRHFENLNELKFTNCTINVNHISTLNLSSITFENTVMVDDEFLCIAKNCQNLTTLIISDNWDLIVDGLKNISNFKNIEILSLENTNTNDDVLMSIVPNNLKILNLASTYVTDDGICAFLKSCSYINFLDITSTQISVLTSEKLVSNMPKLVIKKFK